MREKAANVQRKTLKDITLKTWRTLAQDLFKKLQASLAPWKQNEASLNIFFTVLYIWQEGNIKIGPL